MAKAKFDIKTEATRGLYAGAGVADLAVETVREYVAEAQTRFADVQKNVAGFDYSREALRKQVNARVEALSKDAKARRAAAEARVAELRKEATTLVSENANTATDAYGDLVKRGETLVGRIRRQEATKATTRSAKTTSSQGEDDVDPGEEDRQEVDGHCQEDGQEVACQEQRQGDHHGRQEHGVQRRAGHHRRRVEGGRLNNAWLS